MPISGETLKALESELAYQRATGGEWAHKNRPSVSDELVLARVYLDRAFEAKASKRGDDAALDVMRKVAGILVRCFEYHGVQARVTDAM